MSMEDVVQVQGVRLKERITVPGDKSITHRAVLFGALALGETRCTTSILGRDNLGTIRIMRQLGVRIDGSLTDSMLRLARAEGLEGFERSSDAFCRLDIYGRGFHGLKEPKDVLDCGNSGTTARLLTGILAGLPFSSTLDGDRSLRSRPFKRVVEPLGLMGAKFSGDMLPLTVTGGALKGIEYSSPKASAQVKSALLLAGLQAKGPVIIEEPRASRDHTEHMFRAMGVNVRTTTKANGSLVVELPEAEEERVLQGIDIEVPGDFSAAAFFLVAASIFQNAQVCIVNVGYNPTRIGLLQILKRMGAKIVETNHRQLGGEEVVDLEVESASLNAVEVSGDDVVLAIDEIPILAVAAAFAVGETVIRGAEELRVKESDRLAMTRAVLESFGVAVEELPDGLKIQGDPRLKTRFQSGGRELPPLDAAWRLSGDHRIAMSGAIFEAAVSGGFSIRDVHAVETSFPEFVQCFQWIV